MVLTQQSIWVKELQDKDRPFIIERPKVLYNSATNKYVMWFHLDATELVAGNGWRRIKRRRRKRRLEAGIDEGCDSGAHNGTVDSLTSHRSSESLNGRKIEFEVGQLNASNHHGHRQHRRELLDEDSFDPRGPRLGSGGRRGNKHHFRYFFRRAGVAMSDSPIGPFRFVHALQPDGLPSLDLQLFQEPDQARGAFLIRSVDNK